MKNKIVIIGANDFQRPLIQKAKEMGYETHVFAWREGATGAEDADFFYEISITEKERILEICRELRPDAVATIGSDLANLTVAYLGENLGLPGNGMKCATLSTNKGEMRKAFQKAGLFTPYFRVVGAEELPLMEEPEYPVIVKPTDRSGSRAITRVFNREELEAAVLRAVGQSFEKKAIVEGYLSGAEYSVETISFEGEHTCLAITKKFTTGEPSYIEVGHIQPARLTEETEQKIKETVFLGLDALGVRMGAAHSELRVDREGNVRIIEIGSRMGGDCIGSDLVPLSVGADFVGMVVDTAAGKKPKLPKQMDSHVSAVRFLMNQRDWRHFAYLQKNAPQAIKKAVIEAEPETAVITDSGSRPGFYILQADSHEEMELLLHPDIREGLEQNPVPVFETPIQKLPSDFMGGKNEIYVKRDDLLPFSFGGNKVRFARAFLEDMGKNHCDSMIIYGNYHSNLCRILATLCRQLSIPCYMIHNTEDVKEAGETANSRIIRQMGVKEFPCTRENIADAVGRAMDELREKGFRPYYIYGNERGEGREWVPMKAYVDAYEEIRTWETEQGEHFDYVFLASSTNATQSGLLMGSLLAGDNRSIVGISVSRTRQRGQEVIGRNLCEYAKKFGISLPEDAKEHILFIDRYLEGGYGSHSSGIARIIWEVYVRCGMALDMTYTGKGFYGMIQYLKEQGISGKKILFLHTGGTPLFFDFLEGMDKA